MYAQPAHHDPVCHHGDRADLCFRGAGMANDMGWTEAAAMARLDALPHTGRGHHWVHDDALPKVYNSRPR